MGGGTQKWWGKQVLSSKVNWSQGGAGWGGGCSGQSMKIDIYPKVTASAFCSRQHGRKAGGRQGREQVLSMGPRSDLVKKKSSLVKTGFRGFPGGAVVENLPANAGDTGLSPGLGGSHMPWSNWAHELQLLSLSIWSLCSATSEAAIVRGPHSPQLEKTLTQKRRPNTAKNKHNK